MTEVHLLRRAGALLLRARYAQGLWSIVRFDRSTNERTVDQRYRRRRATGDLPGWQDARLVSRRDADTVLVARALDTGAERSSCAG